MVFDMKYDVTILFPCLNEEKTLDECIKTTKSIMDNTKYKYEILISDNGSTDNSLKIAKKNKVRVVNEEVKGYGSALRKGIEEANGKYVVMLDCDCSYNINDIPNMIKQLEKGYDLVIGKRIYKYNPIINRIGVFLLSLYSNILFHTKVKDFHCGLRAFKRKKILNLKLSSIGMEYASEMIIKAKLNKYKICNYNTDFYKDKRDGKPHLRRFRDGLRHLHLINKIKFDTSLLFRYLSTFMITALIGFILLLITAAIRVDTRTNLVKSFSYYKEEERLYYISKDFQNESYIVDSSTDQRMLASAYLLEKKEPLRAVIEADTYGVLFGRCDLDNVIDNPQSELINYARYWHGYLIVIKPLLALFEAKYMYIINIIVTLILFIILLKLLIEHDKALTMVFLIGSICINTFIVPFCFEYVFLFYVAYIMSILTIKMYDKKSKYMDLLFLINGMLTCYFDFLTAETLALTLPLFIYSYLYFKDNKKTDYREAIKYIFLWGIGYVCMFGLKWFIATLFYGPSYLSHVYERGSIRMLKGADDVVFKLFGNNMYKVTTALFPFNLFNNIVVPIILLVLALIQFIFRETNKKNKLIFIILAFIPIVRIFALGLHVRYHLYFAYRAILPIAMVVVLEVFRLITRKK